MATDLLRSAILISRKFWGAPCNTITFGLSFSLKGASHWVRSGWNMINRERPKVWGWGGEQK